jgi:hypothetical protein
MGLAKLLRTEKLRQVFFKTFNKLEISTYFWRYTPAEEFHKDGKYPIIGFTQHSIMATRSIKRKKTEKTKADHTMLLDAVNYKILLLAVGLLALGFGGMYIENAFKGWFSLYVAPILVVTGFVLVAVGIMKKHSDNEKVTESENL